MFTEVRHASVVTQALVMTLGIAVTGLTVGLAVSPTGGLGWLDVLPGALALAICAAAARMSSVVAVGPEAMTLSLRLGGVPVWRRRIPGHEIDQVQGGTAGGPTVDALSAGGLGLRFLGGGRVALMVRQGEAVRIVVRGGRREYLVASGRARELTAAVAALAARTPTPR
ncbi:hypothetical protein [Oerskovia enterophila]|uniref:Bacterial Pleckstrin homology domain-containing protein n=1 Tax=Oerskovia enterophila TaxID=43678 RepID=A0A161XAL9_9CELL|nr:hypothetical protein [Oerskovia enterophila]KZM33587.1 hypothetical protein OJAG_39070 [Oerskovia enterophila]